MLSPPFNEVQTFLLLAGPEPVLLHMSTCLENIAPAADISGYTVSKAACLKLMDYFAANSQLHGVHLQPRWAHTDMNGHQKQAQDVGKYISHGCSSN